MLVCEFVGIFPRPGTSGGKDPDITHIATRPAGVSILTNPLIGPRLLANGCRLRASLPKKGLREESWAGVLLALVLETASSFRQLLFYVIIIPVSAS